jgi:universal stress protein E
LALKVVASPEATFHRLHACAVPSPMTLGQAGLGGLGTQALPSDSRDQLRRARAAMNELLEDVDFGGRTVKVHLREGAPEPSLLRAIETLRPGLLVLGTHGRTGLPHALFGSVAEAMMRHARCDVLVVRLEKPAFSLP